tara:strand:+ start:60 stop:1508 length:1449 start_codon:yes stop_codon:yes gene_type:complete
MFYKKKTGVLLPLSALHGPGPTGDLDGAPLFIEWLAAHGFSAWQVLPLSPPDMYGSPYSSWSSFAGYPAYVGLRWLENWGLLDPENSQPAEQWVDHDLTSGSKLQAVLKGAERLVHDKTHPLHEQMTSFQHSSQWAVQAAMFCARKERNNGQHWWLWPENENYESRKKDLSLSEMIWLAAFFIFDVQYSEVKALAVNQGIEIIGDVPLYPAHDSADVWANKELFQLAPDGQCINIAGVPPDDQFKLGQVWGNPLYQWSKHKQGDFAWWHQRIERARQLYDRLRLDHFIGFSRYWSIPTNTGLIDSASGQWIEAPGKYLFAELMKSTPPEQFIAEDLGCLDDNTIALRDHYDLPGTKVAIFGFNNNDYKENPHRLENLHHNSILYSSTHDTNTIKGWWEDLCDQDRTESGLGANSEAAYMELMTRIETSKAGLVIYQFQDLLGIGSEGRTNRPGTTTDNWRWRLSEDDLHNAERGVTLLRSLR